jgi:hypothetical protein
MHLPKIGFWGLTPDETAILRKIAKRVPEREEFLFKALSILVFPPPGLRSSPAEHARYEAISKLGDQILENATELASLLERYRHVCNEIRGGSLCNDDSFRVFLQQAPMMVMHIVNKIRPLHRFHFDQEPQPPRKGRPRAADDDASIFVNLVSYIFCSAGCPLKVWTGDDGNVRGSLLEVLLELQPLLAQSKVPLDISVLSRLSEKTLAKMMYPPASAPEAIERIEAIVKAHS